MEFLCISASVEIPSEIHTAPYYSFPFRFQFKEKGIHAVHHIPLSPLSFLLIHFTQPTSILSYTLAMASQQALTKIEKIVAARYGPLVLPTPLNAMLAGDYQEFMPKFISSEGISAKEHLEPFIAMLITWMSMKRMFG